MASDSDQELLDLIDRGSYGYTRTLLSKKIAKFPQKYGYQALQNKILFLTGQEELAVKNNVALLNKLPNDSFSIEVLNEFFVEVGMDREANLVYENAIKKYPISSTDLSLTWWETSIDKFDVKLFNKIFMHLHKNNKSSRLYAFWYSFTFYLLVNQDKYSEKETTLYKSLGKRIIQGLMPFENTQELFVYVKFLQLEEDYTSVEEAIIQAGFNLDLDLQLIYLDAMKQNFNWQKLYDYCEDLLMNQKFNDYDCWKLYILAGTKLNKTYEEMNEFSTFTFSRNSLLAQIELAKAYGNQPQILVKIDQYYEKFNHKLCCYFDLINFQDDFDPAFLGRVNASTEQILQSNPIDVNQLTRLINNQKFTLLLETPNVDCEADFLTTNWKIHQIYKDNTSIQGGEFDNNPLNELNLVSIILGLSRNQTSKNIIRNIGIISSLLQQDKYNHKLKLWIIKLYSQLNSFSLIEPVYSDLKIKMAQHETLNHYLTNINPSKQSLDYLVNIFRFYLTSKEEIKSGISQGFNSGVFNKLEGFLKFGKRMTNSISLNYIISKIFQFSLVVGDTGYLNYFVVYLKKSRHLIMEKFPDNRDFRSEWKLGLKRDNYDLLNITVDEESSLKLKLLIYSILYEENPNQIQKLLKNYNKIISSVKITSPFDNLLFKLYFNLLKIVKSKLNNQEVQSLCNFIQKNLKIDKLKAVLIPDDLLSSKLNHNLVNLAEFLKIIQLLKKSSGSSSSIIDQLINISRQLVYEIKQLNLVNKQVELIDDMVFDLPFVFDISETTSILKESIANTSIPIFNALSSV